MKKEAFEELTDSTRSKFILIAAETTWKLAQLTKGSNIKEISDIVADVMKRTIEEAFKEVENDEPST